MSDESPSEARQFDFWLGHWNLTWVIWKIHYERET